MDLYKELRLKVLLNCDDEEEDECESQEKKEHVKERIEQAEKCE